MLLSWKLFWPCGFPERVLGITGSLEDTLRANDLDYFKWNAFLGNFVLKAQFSGGRKGGEKVLEILSKGYLWVSYSLFLFE